MAKTLIDFRAEKGLYLKDVAEKTGIPEDELRAIEASGTMPTELGQRIISQYALPADYFAEPIKIQINSAKKTPANSTKYFFVTALIWGLITSAVASIPSYISMIAASVFSAASAFGGYEAPAILSSSPVNLINNYFPILINVISGIFLAKFILKNTNYSGNIKKYQFLYPILPDAAIIFLSMGLGLIYETVMSKVLDSSASVDSPAYLFASLGSTAGLSLITSIILMLASAFICAKLLDTAITENEEKRVKFFKTLAIIITVSTVLTAIIYVIRCVVAEDIQIVKMIQNMLGYILTVVLAWAVALVKTDNKKLELAVYTVLPILAIIL